MSFLFTFSSDENMNDGVLRVWVDGILSIDLSTVPRVAKRTVTSGLWSTIGSYGGNTTVLTTQMGSQHARTGHMPIAKP